MFTCSGLNSSDSSERDSVFCFLFFKEKMCEEKSFLCQEAGSDQNSWSEGREARSEPLSGSMNETLRRDRAWRRGLGAIWGTDCWNGCSHWCKVHPLFGLVPDSASNQRLWQQNFTHIKFGRGENRLSAQHLQNKHNKKKKRRRRNTRQKQKEACVKLKVFLCACVFGFYSTCWGFIKVFRVFYLFDPGLSGAGSAPHTSCSVLFCPKSGLNGSVAPDRRVFSSSAVCFPLNAVIPLRRHRISVRPATMAVWSVHQSPTAADSAALWLAFGPLPDRWQSSEWVLNQYSRTVWSQIDK